VRKNNGWIPPVRAAAVALAFLMVSGLPAAEIKVEGLGFLGNRKARNNLALLLGDQAKGPLSAAAIEDATLILFSQLAADGYLQARILVEARTTDRGIIRQQLNARLDESLPRPLAAEAVTLVVDRGRQLQLTRVNFKGLQTLAEEDARAFFLGANMLIPLSSARIYSPGRVQRGISNLQEELLQRGYAEASVSLGDVQVDEKAGKATVEIVVSEGLPWVVGELRLEVAEGDVPPEVKRSDDEPRWTAVWRQNLSAEIRRWYYARGFPDVRVRLVPLAAPPVDGRRRVDVTARIIPGQAVRLRTVKFTGNEHTRESVLRRLVDLEPGQPLNPIALDNAQARMSRLGVFSDLTLRYDPTTGPERNAIFALTEGRRKDINLLLGYGSYEQLRGGVELNNYNVLGRAHTSSLKLIQSMKGTQGEELYTIPEIFGTTIDGSARLFGLRREELSFVRQEFGATVSLLWPLGPHSSLTTGYTFRRLRSTNNELATSGQDEIQSNAASVDLGWLQDRRDNPLTPRHGYKLFAQVEAASRYLGGQVDYQRLLLDASYHTSWGRGRWIHAGLTHGLITTLGSEDDRDLPVNVRYFPGGDGSIRGYRRGEAAPRAANGQFIGAKTYLQLNLELEQALTGRFSIVAFADALGTAVELADYPFSDRLYSAGLGLRYNTLIGPVRLEYGYNLNPRPLDPKGTLQISLGFPF
jgi:outer membrane protein insertion porin family